jgi:5-methylcytosine-specific restriction endonuclease McrA
LDISTQICSRCKNPFPATLQYFSKGNKKNGLHSHCKPCQQQASHDSYMTNRESVLQRTSAYQKAHPEMNRASTKKWRLKDPVKTKQSAQQTYQHRKTNGKLKEEWQRRTQSGRQAKATKRYHQNHPEAKKTISTKHKKKLAERGLTLHSRWKKNRPDSVANKNRLRTIGRQDMKINGVTAIGIYERDAGKCHLCHRPVSRKTFTLDHIIPKSLNGPGTWENLALAHKSCNSKRGVDRMPAQYRLF